MQKCYTVTFTGGIETTDNKFVMYKIGVLLDAAFFGLTAEERERILTNMVFKLLEELEP